jgi:hypothetical protein
MALSLSMTVYYFETRHNIMVSLSVGFLIWRRSYLSMDVAMWEYLFWLRLLDVEKNY